jgi:hypothetical protein
MTGSNGVKCSKVEEERRVRAVQEWILLGYATADIIRQVQNSYGINERMAYKYYKKAFELWNEENRVSMEHKKAYHLAFRRSLIKNLKDKSTPKGAKAALNIADSMAKIDGVLKKNEFAGDNEDDENLKINKMLLPTEKEIEV